MTTQRSTFVPGLLAALAALLLSACGTPYRTTSAAAPPRSPITYAIVLYLGDGETLDEDDRLNALALARDTLLAAGIITPQDRMISDVERAQQLYRARVENGVLTEIAGVPSVSNSTTVVLSRPHYSGERLFWETSYPYGYPGSFESIHSGFPLPGPGWGYPAYGRGGYGRRDRDRDYRGDHRGGHRDDQQRDRDRDRGPRPPRTDDSNNAGRRMPDPNRDGSTFVPPPRPVSAPPPRMSPAPAPAPTPPPAPSVDRSDPPPSRDSNPDRGAPDRSRYRRDKID